MSSAIGTGHQGNQGPSTFSDRFFFFFFFFWSKDLSYHRSYKLQRTVQGVSSRLRDLAVGGFRRLIRLIKKGGTGQGGKEGRGCKPDRPKSTLLKRMDLITHTGSGNQKKSERKPLKGACNHYGTAKPITQKERAENKLAPYP